jgi:hypothetical protein
MYITKEYVSNLCDADANEREIHGVQERSLVSVHEVLEWHKKELAHNVEIEEVQAEADEHPVLVDDDMKIKDRMLDRKMRGQVIFAA